MYQQLPEAAREYIVSRDLPVHLIHVSDSEAIPLPEHDVVVSGIYHSGDEVLFVRSTKTGRDWELPTGRVEPEESIEEALERELKEETGRSVVEYDPVGAIIWSFPEKPIVNFVFRTVLEGDVAETHPEIDTFDMFDELPDRVSFSDQAIPFYEQLLSDAVGSWNESTKQHEKIARSVTELASERHRKLALGVAVSGAITLGMIKRRLSSDEPEETTE